MQEFIDKHQDKIHGVLSCFDRMLFRGYLPIMSGYSMAQFLNSLDLNFVSLKPFLLDHAQQLKSHAVRMAQREGRPFQYLATNIRKEDAARKLAERDGIEHGLVCIYSMLEPCRTFSFRFQHGRPSVQSTRRKCLHLYYYFMDRDFGLMHVKLQTWFPLQMQVYLNGHEWLARKLTTAGLRFSKCDNVFLEIEDLNRAQRFADRFVNLNWPAILGRYAHRVNPVLKELLPRTQYYWVTAQSEYSTDVLFKSRENLKELYPQLISHGTQCFGAREVMSFLGRKLHGKFEGEIISDLSSGAGPRIGGARIKHRVKQNWIKMYDKTGLVLRVETVINDPTEFRVRKRVLRQGRLQMEWVQMRKGVGYLFRYREVSCAANSRYLNALAVVADPTEAKHDLHRLTTVKKDAAGRTSAAFNPLAEADAQLFQSLMEGSHCLRGFNNRDIRGRPQMLPHLRTCGSDAKKQSAKITRTFRRFHAHGLIAKIPRSRRWRVTNYGLRVMGASLYLRDQHFAQAYASRAAA